MSLSSIAVEQREREAKKLNSLLAFGLIGSLALHIGVLSINIGNLTKKVTEVKDEPLEIEIVELPDTPKPEEKTPPAKISSTTNSEAIALSSSNDVTPAKAFAQPSPKTASAIAPSQPVIKAEKPPIAVAPTQEIERVKTQPIPPQKVAPPPKATISRQPPPVAKVNASSEIATQPKPIVSSPPLESASSKPAPPIQQANRPESSPTSPAQQPSDRQLRNLLASTRNAQPNPSNSVAVSKPSAVSDRQTSNIANNLRNQTGSNNAVASTTRETSNNSGQSTTSSPSSNSNNSGRIATGSASQGGRVTRSRRSGSTVATGAQNSRGTSQPNASSNTGSRASDGIGCVRCSKPKYPEKARRRGLEGNAEISVDTDSRGNVTNVRLARSSGHSELDKAALAEAKRWKLKPTNGGKQGVVAKVDFAIEGSERSRKRQQQRKKRQQTEQRRTTPTTETANAGNPTRRKRNITSTQNATAPTPTRRKRNITSTQNATAPRRTQIRRVDTLPPRRTGDVPQRQRPTATSQANSRTRLRQSLRRQRPTENRATPKTQTQLRQSLRQLRQTSQPAANPANE